MDEIWLKGVAGDAEIDEQSLEGLYGQESECRA